MATQTSMAVVAEKPSVARDIARILNATKRGDGYLHGDGYIVTWAIGHLVALAQPARNSPGMALLAARTVCRCFPSRGRWSSATRTKDQFDVVQKDPHVPRRSSSIVCATDAGPRRRADLPLHLRSGGCDKPVQRLWISSLTPEAIRDGFATLQRLPRLRPARRCRPGPQPRRLAGRHEPSRAYTLGVQRRFLRRPRADADARDDRRSRTRDPEFRARGLSNVVATFSPRAGDQVRRHLVPAGRRADGCRGKAPGRRRRSGRDLRASARRPGAHREDGSADAAHGAAAAVRSDRVAAPRQPAVRIQRAEDARTRAGAVRTPQADQLSTHGQPASVAGCRAHAAEDRATPLRASTQDSSRPAPASVRWAGRSWTTRRSATTTPSSRPVCRLRRAALDPDERKIFDLVCRRLLSAWHDEHIWSVTTIITLVVSDVEDRFHSSGTAVVSTGWKVLDIVVREELR